jgi:hypothetical protein
MPPGPPQILAMGAAGHPGEGKREKKARPLPFKKQRPEKEAGGLLRGVSRLAGRRSGRECSNRVNRGR